MYIKHSVYQENKKNETSIKDSYHMIKYSDLKL